MGMLAVFCTNAINIYAGINGIEPGQSLIIAASVAIFNIFELSNPYLFRSNLFSLYFMLPFSGTCFALFLLNKYPAKVFVGDTFCYFAGMTFAVVAILGHFSKTLLLFFIPQVINFLFSTPQLFKFVPCPRHRLPSFNEKTGDIDVSWSDEVREDSVRGLGWMMLRVTEMLCLVRVERRSKDGERWMRFTNMTILVLVLKFFGPMRESRLTWLLMGIQVMFSMLAFFIRFRLAGLFYDVVE